MKNKIILCSDIDFEKLSLLFTVNRADYLLPKVIGGNITNLKTYIFHSFSNEIVIKKKSIKRFKTLKVYLFNDFYMKTKSSFD